MDCTYVGIAFQLIDDTAFTHMRLSFNCDCCRGGCCIEFYEDGRVHNMQFWSILCRTLGIEPYDECMRTEAEIEGKLSELTLFVDAAPYLGK